MKHVSLISLYTAAILTLTSGTSASAMDGVATLINENGKTIGTVTLTETPSGITRITISAGNISKGWHGLHIHETGDCNPEDGFKSAGGHLAGDRKHGILDEDGPHPGDLPNHMVLDGGILVAEIFSNRLNMTSEGTAAVFDEDGSAVVIHSGPDDYTSQPSGAAGSRIACGVIEQK